MKIRPLGAELLHADGQTKRSRQPLFTMLRKKKTPKICFAYSFILRPCYLTFISNLCQWLRLCCIY